MKKIHRIKKVWREKFRKITTIQQVTIFCDNHSTAFIQIRELITEPPTYTGRDKHNKEFTFLPQDDDIQFFVFK